MGEKPEWRGFAAIGTILVAITFTDLSPEGPWNDATFTSGSIGLIGIGFVYLAWFRLTFERRGVVPTLDLWRDPSKTSLTVIGVGLVTLGIAYAVGRIDFFPEPAGLILSLIGLLITTNGFYVWMSTEGPLSSEEEENFVADNINNQEFENKNSEPDNSFEPHNTVIYNIQNIEINDSVVIDTKFRAGEE